MIGGAVYWQLQSTIGGTDARTLFVTACDAVYRIPTKTTGLLPGPKRS